jgi:myo-inositol-1(or 4)-monophosphatase
VRELVIELALGLRRHVLPFLGSHAGRAHVQAGAGGDVTFEIDREAEEYLERFLAERAPDVSFYSEDRGLVREPERSSRPKPADLLADQPPYSGGSRHQVLIVDPIDGTRPAMAGFESSCVSVAAAPLDTPGGGGPTMGDVHTGCIAEIKSGVLFIAERGGGIEIRNSDGSTEEPALSTTTELRRLFWTLGFRGRPARPLVQVLEELIDLSSVGGAVFDLGSATYDLTRIVTGQLDAYIDVGPRMIDEVPRLRERFEAVGGGAVLNNSPYDLAAAVLCLEEAGAVVTDAYGEPLGSRPLLGSGHEFQMSCLAAASEPLHALLLEALERGFSRLARSP